MNIVFMGTPDFAVPTLEALINSKHNVLAVVTKTDKPKGRSKTPVFSPVKEAALKHGIRVLQPVRIRDDENVSILKSLNPDVIVVVAYGQILSKEILDIAPFGCINVHASLLPAWRGAAPIQWSIINGDAETGVSIMQMDEGLDTGDILSVKKVKITDEDTGGSLFDKLKDVGAKELIEVLDEIPNNSLIPKKQGQTTTPYAKMLTKDMGLIDFNDTSKKIINKIRGLSPWPGAYTYLNGKNFKVWKAIYSSDSDLSKDDLEKIDSEIKELEFGSMYIYKNAYISVKTKDGFIFFTDVQIEGKKRMEAELFLRGMRFKEVVILGKKQ